MALKNNVCVVFDIETGPLPDEVLRERFVFKPEQVKDYGLLSQEFDPSSVKMGNLKDPEKIRAKLDAAREDFETRRAAAKAVFDVAEPQQFAEFKSRAALSALTGRVLAFGFQGKCETAPTIYHLDAYQSEKDFMQTIVDVIRDFQSQGTCLCGHNIRKFDLPFLFQRAWTVGVDVPWFVQKEARRFESNYYVDTMQLWGDYVSLDTLAAAFGTTRKNGDGARFSDLYFGLDAERKQALKYLANDVTMTVEIARRMGVFHE